MRISDWSSDVCSSDLIAERGVNASKHHEGTMVEQIDLNSWVTMSVNRAVEEIQSRLTGGLSVLATVGSTAPFVGLFGTVWGIYHALTAIGLSGQARSEEHTSELQSLMRSSYAVFCLKK